MLRGSREMHIDMSVLRAGNYSYAEVGNLPQGSFWPNREGNKWEFSQVVSELSVSPVTQSLNAKCFVKNRFLW